jgi:[ribosomal protein S5]-alanine N-acetyltransferase
MPPPAPWLIETPRLRLRRLRPADLDDLAALYADPVVRAGYPEGTLTREQTAAEIAWHADGWPGRPELGLWATVERSSGAFIGRCGLLPWTLAGRDEVEVAYLIDPRHWRRGLGREAAAAVARHAREQLGLRRLVCQIEPGNAASIGVATAIGMHCERRGGGGGSPDGPPYLLYTSHPHGE